ncbi:MAG: 2-oxo acid dehydrogenase subunit E2 [Planctomycetes bacterium]|nr:2-oxo acid dehydrogenase subunit E2 [Planctomycetota bacterium]
MIVGSQPGYIAAGSPAREAHEGAEESRAPTCVPLSRIQRLIGARMLAAKHNKPCFYLATRADVTDLMAMRHDLSKALGVKVTSNAFFIHALARAAREHPLMVGRLVHLEPQDSRPTEVIRIADHVNVGFAVNSPQGLVVPVIHGAETQTLAKIAAQEKRLTDKARGNKLTLDDLEGMTLGLSNLGAFDIDTFLGIVPPPISAILTAGKVIQMPVPWNGHVVVRKRVSLSLAADHQIVDSEYAARFLQSLRQRLEDPQRLVEQDGEALIQFGS